MATIEEAMVMNRIPGFVREMRESMRKIMPETEADGLLVRLLYYAMVDELGRDTVHRELEKRMEGQR